MTEAKPLNNCRIARSGSARSSKEPSRGSDNRRSSKATGTPPGGESVRQAGVGCKAASVQDVRGTADCRSWSDVVASRRRVSRPQADVRRHASFISTPVESSPTQGNRHFEYFGSFSYDVSPHS